MPRSEYGSTPPFDKSPESTYASSKPPVMSSESDTEALMEVLSGLAKRSLELDASLLCDAEEIEITVSDARSRKVLDRAWSKKLPALKRFICRIRQAQRKRGAARRAGRVHASGEYDAILFMVRVRGGRGVADRLHAALGLPSRCHSSPIGEGLRISEPRTADAKREITICAQGATYIWRGVTIRFPRDLWQRATIRDTLLALTVGPDGLKQVKARTPSATAPQPSLPL